jgi:hypothetical protein
MHPSISRHFLGYTIIKEIKKMKNVGSKDAMVRYILAAILVVSGIAMGAASGLSIVLYLIAAVLALTAGIKFCPIWKVLNINTSDKK